LDVRPGPDLASPTGTLPSQDVEKSAFVAPVWLQSDISAAAGFWLILRDGQDQAKPGVVPFPVPVVPGSAVQYDFFELIQQAFLLGGSFFMFCVPEFQLHKFIEI
jgi:hypothetical protein